MATIEDTLEASIAKVNELHDAYVELEGTEIPTTIDEAIKQRWEITTAIAELSAFTAYIRAHQEEDSRRAVPLKQVYRVIRDLEEHIIKTVVLKPDTIFANAWFSFELGIWKTLIDSAGVILSGLKNVLMNPKATWQLIWITVSNLVMLRWMSALEVLSIGEIAKAILEGMKARDRAEKDLRKTVLPQRSGKRYRVRRPSRK